MGMYDYLHSISRNIEQNQVDIKKSQEHQKKVEYIQTELEGALLASLQEKIKYNNIFDDEIKAMAIDEVLHSEDLMLYNKDYTRQHLNKKYYTIARQVEQIHKKQNASSDDWKRDLSYKKFEYQKQKDLQKMQLKAQAEAEKIRTLQRKMNQDIILFITRIGIKIFLWCIVGVLMLSIAPVVIMFWLGLGLIKGLAK